MSFTVEYDQEKKHIMVSIRGELNLPVLKDIAFEVSKIINETGSKLILNDLREAIPTKGTFDIYSMPEMARKAGIVPTIKRALIVGERTKDFRFLETVFINQANFVKMFANIEDAEAWLLET